jgi:hypothetical protein
VLEANPPEPTSGVKGVELPADPSPKVDAHPYEIGRRLRWFYYILRRTDTMTEEAKEIIKEELMLQYSYKELIEEDPTAQGMAARRAKESRAEGRKEGRAVGLEEGLAAGREEGLEEGLAAGREEGLAEGIAIGEERARSQMLVQTQAHMRQKILVPLIVNHPPVMSRRNPLQVSARKVVAHL